MLRVVLLLGLVATLGACQSSDVSRELGARCDRSTDCDDRCLAGPDWPGGFCSVDCDSDRDCPSDALCTEEGGGGVCEIACTDDRGCAFLGTGYNCKERDAHGGSKVMVCRGG